MKEIIGNIWEQEFDYLCLPTNKMWDRNGNAILGAGLAKQVKERFPGVEKDMGEVLRYNEEHLINQDVFIIPQKYWKWGKQIIAFSTKYDWKEKSSLFLIKESAIQLEKMIRENKEKIFMLAFPGVGMGGLTKEEVRKVIVPILIGDNIFVIGRKE